MKEFQSKVVMLLILLIAFAFIGLGLTIGIFSLPDAPGSAATAGLPFTPP